VPVPGPGEILVKVWPPASIAPMSAAFPVPIRPARRQRFAGLEIAGEVVALGAGRPSTSSATR